jgi:Cu/Ag efflux pump CusA
MTHRIVSLSLKFRVLLLGAAAAVLALAAVQLPTAPVDELPEFTPPQVQIQTEALGLSAAEVEQLITVPIEHDLLNGVSWLDQIRSESAPGLSSIDLIFEPGTDPLKARQAVQERMSQAFALPPVGNPPVIVQPTSATSRVMMIGLGAQDLSLVDMSVLARWKIRPRLMAVPGVANVTIWGQRDKQLQVQVDPARLHQNGVALSDVISTTGNALWASPLSFVEASTPGTGGFVDMSNQRLAIQHILPITTPQTLASVTIQDASGRTLRLDQVANVVEDHQPLIGDAILPSGQGLMLVVEKFPGANTRDVTNGVEQALDQLRPGLSGVTMDTSVYQAQSYIDSALHDLGLWALAGALLFVLVLSLALFSWRLVAIAFPSTVLSLITATYALWLGGIGFNVMILAGLAVAIGLVVDDALVDLNRIRQALAGWRASGGDASDAPAAVAAAVSAVGSPRVFGTVIALLAPLPLIFLGGVAEAFARPAVIAYVVAVLASTLVALTVTPALALVLLRGETREPAAGPLHRLAGWLFDRTVPGVVRRPLWAYGTVAALVLAALAAVPQVGGRSLLPSPQDRSLLVQWQALPGTSLTEMERITTAATNELATVPGVRNVSAQVGRAVTSDQVANVDSGEIWVTLNDSANYDSTVAAVTGVLRGYPGMHSDVLTYPQARVDAVQARTSDALVVRVYGIDLDVLRQQAETLRQRISTVPGVVRPAVQAQPYQPTIEVEVNLAAAQRYGVNPGDVRRTAATYFAGITVGQLYEEQAVFDVVVKGIPTALSTPDAVSNLLIDTPDGGQVRLGDVATVKVAAQPTVIAHDGTLRTVDVTATVQGRDLGSVLNDVRDRVRTTPMPLEYHAQVLDNLEQQQSRTLQIAGLALVVAVVALLLLQAALGSWRMAGLVLVTLPLAGAGGVLTASLGNDFMTLGALVGFFTVLGIAARNGVVLVGSYRATGTLTGDDRTDAVLKVTRERAGGILLTAVATAAIVLPPALFGKLPGAEVLHPLALAVIGGLVTSTLLALLVLPALYLRLAPSAQPPVEGEPA